jgi:hypothetical protein
VATWWIVGPLDEVQDPRYADYMVRPPDIAPGTERVAGAIALTAALAAIVVLVLEARDPGVDRRWLASGVLPAALAAALVGGSARVMTAGVSGANIGGGMVVLFGGPVLLGLFVWWLCAVTRDPGPGQPTSGRTSCTKRSMV